MTRQACCELQSKASAERVQGENFGPCQTVDHNKLVWRLTLVCYLGGHVCVLSNCIKGKPFSLILGKEKALNFEMGIEHKVNIDCV